ncbi:carbohydrate kinase [Staphylococcus gallinarum]|uniref:Carbohydrate kinase n=3 Tax=Staphylococcus gallinarum TaxID=1293 RepID=A0A380SB86_STAGA|nr:carbohydrate kinase family protein [Staphylococcus gallinarum]RTX83013.1 carbohydrate kinase [Staphylococcus gallinarum]GEQ06556.1 carbohydrate kinase [Staphylococcus gallinarum]SUQ38637.1 PfkB family carbohydrate kinase [Staphylococcus gallinarum]
MKKTKNIVCIGAANIDKQLYLRSELINKSSNPVSSKIVSGGVARNLAYNIGRLSNQNPILLTLVGNDKEGNHILKEANKYINLKYTKSLDNINTGMFTSVINYNGEMMCGFADMDIYDFISIEYLYERIEIIKCADCVIVDSNIPENSIQYLIQLCKSSNVPIAVIPASIEKVKNIPKNLKRIDYLIINKKEAEAFWDISLNVKSDYEKIKQISKNSEIKNIIVTNGNNDIFYTNGELSINKNVQQSSNIINDTGAGDTFSASVLFYWLENYNVDNYLEKALNNAFSTVSSVYNMPMNN